MTPRASWRGSASTWTHAAIVTTPTPQLVVGHAPDRLVLPFSEPLQSSSAVRKGDADFLNFVNSWLAFRTADGWLTERQNDWFRSSDWLKGM